MRKKVMVAGNKNKQTIWKQETGAVAIMFAFFLNIMIVVLALALDMSRAYLAASEMQNAATAASIASAMEDADVDEAKQYFIANLPTGLHSITYDFDADVAVVRNPDNTVSVIPTNFDVPGFFTPALSAGATSSINASSVSIASLPSGKVSPANFAFVLDKSGSMSGITTSPVDSAMMVSKAVATAQATSLVIEDIKKATDAANNYSVAVSTYATTEMEYFTFTTDFDSAIVSVNQYMRPTSSTCGACGALRMKDLLPAAPSGRPTVVIFMTDGMMNTSPGGGYVEPDLPGVVLPADVQASMHHRRLVKECLLMRTDPNVSIWAIGFGAESIRGTNASALSTCASSPDQFKYAPDGKTLGDIFSQIWVQTSTTRLTR